MDGCEACVRMDGEGSDRIGGKKRRVEPRVEPHSHLRKEQADGDDPDHASPGHVDGSMIVVLVQLPVHEQSDRAGRLRRDGLADRLEASGRRDGVTAGLAAWKKRCQYGDTGEGENGRTGQWSTVRSTESYTDRPDSLSR
jgi:hypothetical protein